MEELLTHPYRNGLFLGAIIYFGPTLLKTIPVTLRLLNSLYQRKAKWPGPKVHDLDPKVDAGRLSLGLSPRHLFPEYLFYSLGLFGACLFFILTLISETSYMKPYISYDWNFIAYFFIAVVLISGIQSRTRTIYYLLLMNRFFTEGSRMDEPQQFDGLSTETEYAIEYPLGQDAFGPSNETRAFNLFSEATTRLQKGDRQTASMLYEEATKLDTNLHEHARKALSEKIPGCTDKDAGAIYYWLGVHSEYLADRVSAKMWYEKAIDAFKRVNFPKRESRAHCNLGNVKMNMMDESAMDEFEKAIALNPKNGIAHINIGTAYYRISERGDPRFDLAMEAFADAIVADPKYYGPLVIGRLRGIGYTWKEDLEDITQRVEHKHQKAV